MELKLLGEKHLGAWKVFYPQGGQKTGYVLRQDFVDVETGEIFRTYTSAVNGAVTYHGFPSISGGEGEARAPDTRAL